MRTDEAIMPLLPWLQPAPRTTQACREALCGISWPIGVAAHRVADEALDRRPDSTEHPAQLALPALGERHAIPGEPSGRRASTRGLVSSNATVLGVQRAQAAGSASAVLGACLFAGGILPALLAVTGIMMWLKSRVWRADGSGGLLIWPLFGTTNQLMAALTLSILAIMLMRRRRSALPALIPSATPSSSGWRRSTVKPARRRLAMCSI